MAKKAKVAKPRRPKLEVYEGVDGDGWWTLATTNGKIISDSGEGYGGSSRTQKLKAAERAARRVMEAARAAVLVVDGVEVDDQPNYPVEPVPVEPAVVQPQVTGDTVEAIQPDNASLVVPEQAAYVMRGT